MPTEICTLQTQARVKDIFEVAELRLFLIEPCNLLAAVNELSGSTLAAESQLLLEMGDVIPPLAAKLALCEAVSHAFALVGVRGVGNSVERWLTTSLAGHGKLPPELVGSMLVRQDCEDVGHGLEKLEFRRTHESARPGLCGT